MQTYFSQTNLKTNSWAIRMVESVLQSYPISAAYWHYEHGLVVKAIRTAGFLFQEERYIDFAKQWVDHFIQADGSISTYRTDEYNLDQINSGKLLFHAYQQTREERYLIALNTLHQQLQKQPRTFSNGYWHKKIYPNQMWLDGIYMAGPFQVEYGYTFNQPEVCQDSIDQIILLEQHVRESNTGLLYHAWDESREQPWSDPNNGCSPHFWGRAMGWFEMALIDILDILALEHPDRSKLIQILQRLSNALLNYQHRPTGMWYQIVNMGEQQGNYLESSITAMLVYSFTRGVRKGYLPPEFLTAARRAYRGILENRITMDSQGFLTLEGTCGTAGLGGIPYRNGSFEYYVQEKIIPNDFKGVGPFILAALEMDIANGNHEAERNL
ncbi:MAG: glycosyl hydrolase family 88 [Chloroflexi bacterium HGW-Chloroflexi-10]|nr:MAG: glycosyl hydrolase family 88 [Chloroflexi bacterium HGW-Chloroflexi-10]